MDVRASDSGGKRLRFPEGPSSTFTLAKFLDEFVDPVTSAAGFRRRALTYRRTSVAGDAAIINIRRTGSRLNPIDFYVDYGLAALLLWRFRGFDPRKPVSLTHAAIIENRFDPPRLPPGYGSLNSSTWELDDQPRWDSLGPALATGLHSEIVPRLIGLLDRETLIAELRQPRRGDTIWADGTWPWSEIILTLDTAEPERLDTLFIEAQRGWTPHPRSGTTEPVVKQDWLTIAYERYAERFGRPSPAQQA